MVIIKCFKQPHEGYDYKLLMRNGYQESVEDCTSFIESILLDGLQKTGELLTLFESKAANSSKQAPSDNCFSLRAKPLNFLVLRAKFLFLLAKVQSRQAVPGLGLEPLKQNLIAAIDGLKRAGVDQLKFLEALLELRIVRLVIVEQSLVRDKDANKTYSERIDKLTQVRRNFLDSARNLSLFVPYPSSNIQMRNKKLEA